MKLRVTLFAIGALLIHDVVESRSNHQVESLINPNCECGISGEGISNRIVGGITSVPHIFPWVAAILNKGSLYCGGALINDQYILTAGHCVKWTRHSDLSIGLGMHNIENPEEGFVTPIAKVIIHENFESDYLHDTNDIALIKLKSPVQYSENVRPVCLPAKGSNYTGQNVKVAGWGKVTSGGGPSKYLRQANLKVIPYSTCTNTSYGDHLTESMLCAYSDDTDACQGDSGGPLLFERENGKYETIGVVSWGIGCARRGMPGVYVKNSDYLDWIRSHTENAVYCLDD